MNSRPHLQSFLTNSLAIRQEIQRFESVHPSIYAIYDLIELIQDQQIAQQIRDHVVCIEGECDLLFQVALCCLYIRLGPLGHDFLEHDSAQRMNILRCTSLAEAIWGTRLKLRITLESQLPD
uniref:Uncharacterized protein n=1 Tax=Phlebotomus papatasi TaxID=29031 RepID=A0A1B0GNY5_PHLPP